MGLLPDGRTAEGGMGMSASSMKMCPGCRRHFPVAEIFGERCRECRLDVENDAKMKGRCFRVVSGHERIMEKFKSRRTVAEFKAVKRIAKELASATDKR